MADDQNPKAQTHEPASFRDDKPPRAVEFSWIDWAKSVGAVIALILAIAGIYAEWRISELKVNRAELASERSLFEANQKLATVRARNKELAASSDELTTKIALQRGELQRLEKQISMLNADLQQIDELQKQRGLNQSESIDAKLRQTLAEAISSGNVIATELARQTETVDVRFRGSIERDTVRGFQAALQSAGYQAPILDRTAAIEKSEVIFLRSEDESTARDIASIAKTYFAKRCPPERDFPVRREPTSKPTTKFEVRIVFSCS